MINRYLLVGFIAAVITLSVFMFRALVYQGAVQLNHPDKKEFPLAGIDISHHQRRIDWLEIRKLGLSFVVIKATEGATYKDSLFHYNYKTSKAEGYKTGAYHFYRFCRGGAEQAQNFIEQVPVDSTDFPPVVDLEKGGNCKTDLSNEAFMAEIQTHLDVLEKHYGKRPILYVTLEFYREYLSSALLDYPLWIRDIRRKPTLEPGREWVIWQYANRARVRGINKFVDLNVINGDSFEILEYVQ